MYKSFQSVEIFCRSSMKADSALLMAYTSQCRCRNPPPEVHRISTNSSNSSHKLSKIKIGAMRKLNCNIDGTLPVAALL